MNVVRLKSTLRGEACEKRPCKQKATSVSTCGPHVCSWTCQDLLINDVNLWHPWLQLERLFLITKSSSKIVLLWYIEFAYRGGSDLNVLVHQYDLFMFAVSRISSTQIAPLGARAYLLEHSCVFVWQQLQPGSLHVQALCVFMRFGYTIKVDAQVTAPRLPDRPGDSHRTTFIVGNIYVTTCKSVPSHVEADRPLKFILGQGLFALYPLCILNTRKRKGFSSCTTAIWPRGGTNSL